MVTHTDTTTENLMRAFMQFHRASWHERSVAGCTPSEIKVMFCIARGMKDKNSVITASEISRMMHVTSPTVTQIMKKLETGEFVERKVDDVDRRVARISLTGKGQEVVTKARQEFRDSLHELINYLGEEQAEQLAHLLSQVVRHYNEKAANEHYMELNEEEKL